ncbi:S41 family peptidase [Cohnella lubricantis]|uniref:S41 family peptidase n=1 Tax=Cohnella lubricantis TaxID=2163172 RepID=A0A841TFY0_9BACL|nr:S41 family peptidase [Cohnella lubricantis]MBB6677371.1 S41 family peptidase [Cohnella lubricantis]MBP2118739.1 carboxyl-terminal processing protease [Cohnella lubricantis]
MLYRGRTVLAITVATALLASAATLTALSLAGKADGLLRDAGSTASGAAGGSKPAAAGGLGADELDKLNRAAGLIANESYYSIDRDELIDGAIAGMLGSLGDPYAEYYSKEEAEQLADSADTAFTGIGARAEMLDGELVVVRVLAGTPAERAGLKAGDTLLSVNGDSLKGLAFDEAASRIRGPKGTKAKLQVKRANAAEPIELELIRDRIAAETVSSELDAEGVGILRITKFAFGTSELAAAELGKLESGGMKALIIDLRDNPGGVLGSAESTAELFVPSGRMIVIEEDSQGHRKTITSAGNPTGKTRTYPIVVLINGGSASSAEIVAGALKQSAGATLVGSRTYGKGTVQISFENELGDGSLMKLTVMKWLLPDGSWVEGGGIAPDISVPGLPQQPEPDPQLQAARETALGLVGESRAE